MKLSLNSVSFGSLAALALIVAPLTISQAVRADDMGGHRGGYLESLNLSDTQTNEIEAIRTNARSQKEALLTAEQRATLASEGRRGWRELDLTEAQRTQMDAIKTASRVEIDAVLTPEQLQQRETQRAEHKANRGDRWAALNLSDTQTSEIEAIRTDSRSQMQGVLTPEQQATVETAGEGRRAWRGLDLSETQRSEIDAIREASKTRVEAVLTPEQQQQLAQMKQARSERHSRKE